MKNNRHNKIIPGEEPFFFLGGKIACLLIHGFTGTPKEMRGLGEYLNSRGLSVLGVRLTGHGTSPEDMIRTRWRDWVASVEDGYRLLQNDYDHVSLVGLSMGGILSLFCGAYLPVNKIVAMSTPFELPRDWRIGIAKPLSIISPYMNKGEPDEKDLEAAKEHISYPQYPTRSIAELNQLAIHMRESLQDVTSPVLLMNSKSDGTIPVDHGIKIKKMLTRAPMVYHQIFEQSGHVITEDIEREIVFKDIYNFLIDKGKY